MPTYYILDMQFCKERAVDRDADKAGIGGTLRLQRRPVGVLR